MPLAESEREGCASPSHAPPLTVGRQALSQHVCIFLLLRPAPLGPGSRPSPRFGHGAGALAQCRAVAGTRCCATIWKQPKLRWAAPQVAAAAAWGGEQRDVGGGSPGGALAVAHWHDRTNYRPLKERRRHEHHACHDLGGRWHRTAVQAASQAQPGLPRRSASSNQIAAGRLAHQVLLGSSGGSAAAAAAAAGSLTSRGAHGRWAPVVAGKNP